MAFIDTFGSTNNAAVNPQILDEGLKMEMERNSYFFDMTEEVLEGDVVPEGIVVLKREFIAEGRDSMVMPILRTLKSEGLHGDLQQLGEEETQIVDNTQVPINVTKHAVRSPGRASRQRSKRLQIFQKARPQLGAWYGQEIDFEHFRALTEGASNNVTDAKSIGGIGFTPAFRSHVNMFATGIDCATVAPDGVVTFDSTLATYDSVVNDAVCAMEASSATAGTFFQLQVLDRLIPRLHDLKIEPVMIGGQQMYVALIHVNAWQQASETASAASWNALLRDIGTRGETNAILKDAKGVYKNFIIHTSFHVPGAISGASNSPTYGSATPHSSLDTATTKVNFILGRQSLNYAIGEDLQFNEELTDYGNFQGVQSHQIFGVTRPDFVDDRDPAIADTGRNGRNISSLAFLTNSGFGAVTAA